jgi:hypothetical protein
MPISAERLQNLLIEHETVLRAMRELYVEHKTISRSTQAPEIKLARLDALIDSIANPPDAFALIERANHNRNAKENLRQREKQRKRRLALGITPRPLKNVGTYAQLLQNEEQLANYELTRQERDQLAQLSARQAAQLDYSEASPDQPIEDTRVALCYDKFFLPRTQTATRAEFTEFCVTNGLDEPIDYFLDDLIAQGLIERRDDGTYATIRTGPPVEDVIEF